MTQLHVVVATQEVVGSMQLVWGCLGGKQLQQLAGLEPSVLSGGDFTLSQRERGASEHHGRKDNAVAFVFWGHLLAVWGLPGRGQWEDSESCRRLLLGFGQ